MVSLESSIMRRSDNGENLRHYPGFDMRFSVFYPVADYRDDDEIDLRALYENTLQIVDAAERLGYHGVYFNEGHIFRNNFRLPNPALLIAAASQRTRRLMLGAALILLPYRDPRLVAEDIAVLDALTEGRLIAGVGPGFHRPEIEEFGYSNTERRRIFDEKFRALNEFLAGNEVTQTTEYYRAKAAQIGARPQRDIAERLYRGTVSIDGALAIGESGWGMMCSPLERRSEFADREGAEFMRECIAAHRLAWMRSPRRDEKCPPALMQVYCAVEDDEASLEARAADAFERFQIEVCRRDAAGRRKYFAEYAANTASMIGTVDTLKRRIGALAQAGVDEIMLMFNFGGLDQKTVLQTMERFMDRVAPDFLDVGPEFLDAHNDATQNQSAAR